MVAQRDRAVRRWTTRGGVLASVAAVGIDAGSGSAAAETFRWAFQGDIQTLDSHGLFETFTLGFQANSYEGLLTRPPDLKLQPALATSWENVEQTTWSFPMPKGDKFNTGNALHADPLT